MKKKNYIWARRLSQLVFFAGLLYIIWAAKYPLTTSLNPSLYFKLDPFVMFATVIAERVFLTGAFFAIFTLVVTFIFGRVFCGWFCPLGALQDFWAYVPKRLKRKYPEKEPSTGIIFKFIIAAVVFGLAVFKIQAAWVFDPFAIFVRAFSFNIFPWLNKLIEGGFVLALRNMENPGIVEKAYYYLKDNVLALNSPLFPHTIVVFLIFAAILALAVYKRRFWCRYLCPLGAVLAVAARHSPFERRSGACRENCSLCRSVCRMNAIRKDNTYHKEECILCLDCTSKCPWDNSRFAFGKKEPSVAVIEPLEPAKGITRSQFLLFAAGALAFLSGVSKVFAKSGSAGASSSASQDRVIRPPAALEEEKFVQRCIRCGNCMKVCPTNVLQPAILEAGINGIWTPKFDTKIGYCEYKCNLCGKVCPTAAIENISVEQKMRTRMGLAEIDERLCLPWAKGEECIVCEEHCPVAEKAIKLIERKGKNGAILKLPFIDESLCVGCAICEFKCPVSPSKAVKVKPL